MTLRMLGRTVHVVTDASTGAEVLRDELRLYPEADGKPDLTVRYEAIENESGALLNPRTHSEFGDGFVMRQRMANVHFMLADGRLDGVRFYPTHSSSTVLTRVRRMADMQYTSREERAGVIFHEMVLVPAAHWMTDMAVVHASAFSDSSGRVTLIGGTGGVGKTSLALDLCLHRGYRFLADDIAFVDDAGHVWPNFAYPKIYAYNLEDSPELSERILSGRGAMDRIHWLLHRSRGAQFVRRRIAPDVLYGNVDRAGGALHRYVILAREERSDVHVEEITPARAASMSTALMQPEYYSFHNHLHWHAYNRAVSGRPPSTTVPVTVDRWTHLLTDVLAHVGCLLVRVPASMPHAVFKQSLSELLAGAE